MKGTKLAARCALLLAIGMASALAAEPDDIGAIVRDYDAFARIQDPVRAAQRGDSVAMERWPDNSPKAVALRKGELVSFLARLDALEGTRFGAADALNRELLRERVALALEGLGFDEERIAFISGDGFYTTADYAALNTRLGNASEAAAWLARLRALPAYYAIETENMKRGVNSGFTQPRLTVERAIADMRERVAKPLETSPLLKPFDTLPPSFPAAERESLRAEALQLLQTQLRPAEEAVLAFLEQSYLPAARADIGASSLPGGREWYAFLVRRHTTTAMSPDEIHELGQREVARIREAMDKVMEEAGFNEGLPAFLQFLRSDPRFYLSADSYGEKASEIAKRADEALPRFFGLLPRLTYGVRPMPEGLESSSAGYLTGSPEQGIAGLVVYKPWMVVKLPSFGIAAWTLHEGVPGHHLQIALAQEFSDLPEFRRNDDITAFVEGWALYAEKLGEDMGIYRNAYERFGRLSLEMWRACRLMIDTGMHWKGWSREQAAACLQENSALAQTEIDFELDRYIAWPGQALAYKVGEQKIIELRRRAESQLGDSFDLRAFHDLILGSGPMPLGILERQVETALRLY